MLFQYIDLISVHPFPFPQLGRDEQMMSKSSLPKPGRSRESYFEEKHTPI